MKDYVRSLKTRKSEDADMSKTVSIIGGGIFQNLEKCRLFFNENKNENQIHLRDHILSLQLLHSASLFAAEKMDCATKRTNQNPETAVETTVEVRGSEELANTYYGRSAGAEDTGSQNSLFGVYAGYFNKNSLNTFAGYGAGRNNQGTSVVGVGCYAGYSNEGEKNIFLDARSGYENTSGAHNTLLGAYSGYKNGSG